MKKRIRFLIVVLLVFALTLPSAPSLATGEEVQDQQEETNSQDNTSSENNKEQENDSEKDQKDDTIPEETGTVEDLDEETEPKEETNELDLMEEEEEDCDHCIFNENTGLNKFLASSEKYFRIAGKNRIATSIAISQFLREQSDTVIISDSQQFYDALSGSVLTKGKYPILLIQNKLSQETQGEIQRLNPKTVYLLGGPASVSTDVEVQLQDLGFEAENIIRIAGKDRYETSQKIAETLEQNNFIFASGENFPDALAASPYAASISGNIIFTGSRLSPQLQELLQKKGKPVIVGGNNSVNPNLFPGAKDIISGSNRYATAVQLANRLNPKFVIMTSGENFPDALAISSVAMGLEAPILLSEKNQMPKETIEYLKNHRQSIDKIILVGGTGSLSEQVLLNVREIIATGEIQTVPEPPVDYAFFQKTPYIMTLKNTKLSGNITIPKGKICKVISVNPKQKQIGLQYNGQGGFVEDPTAFGPSTIRKSNTKVPYISQLYPVYAPVGCEPTALLMGLHGKSYAKGVGLRKFLNDMPKHRSNPDKGFVGTPYRGNESLRTTIHPEPLANYAKQYGPVANIQGSSMDDIIMELDNGNPVLIYVTLHWRGAYYRWYHIEGQRKRYLRNNHGVLLTGYEKDKNVFYVADPYNNHRRKAPYYYTKSRRIVEPLYNLRKHAVVVR